MNTRGLALQGALAAVGLVAAYLTWQRAPEGMPGEITILDISKRALEKVRWEDATRYVELFRNPEEVAALREYFNKGGRLLVALDPEGPTQAPLLEFLGVKYTNTPLANDQVFFRTSRQISDRANLGTSDYSSHPSVSTLAQLGGQAPVAFLGAGLLEPSTRPPEGVTVDVAVRSHDATFMDPNRNFTPDDKEERRNYPLVLAAQKGTGKDQSRAVVMADSDALMDGVLPNLGNVYLALDALRWLTGEEAISGTVTSEEDVPIQHTREQDTLWFWATVLLAPAVVLGVGFFVTRRRGKRAPAVPQGGA